MQGGGVGGLLWGGGFFKKPSFHQLTQFFFSGVLLLTILNLIKQFYFVKFTKSPHLKKILAPTLRISIA